MVIEHPGPLHPYCEREELSSLKRNLCKCVGGFEGAERRTLMFQAMGSNSGTMDSDRQDS